MVYSFFISARNWADKEEYTLFLIFFPPRSGFVQQAVEADTAFFSP